MKNFLYVFGTILAVTSLSCKKDLKVSPVPEEDRYIAPCTVKLDTLIVDNDSINGDLIPRQYPIDSVYGEFSISENLYIIYLNMGTNYLYYVTLSFDLDVHLTNNIFGTNNLGFPGFREVLFRLYTSDGNYKAIPGGKIYMQKHFDGSLYVSLCDLNFVRSTSMSQSADTAQVTTSFYYTP